MKKKIFKIILKKILIKKNKFKKFNKINIKLNNYNYLNKIY